MTIFGTATILRGDALALPLADASIDAIVCDPPYGLEFMGKDWDGSDGFRRSLNTSDAGRDSVFGRTSRTSPEYRTGRPGNARLRTRVDGRTNPAEGKSTTSTPESYVAGPLFQRWCEAWAFEALRVLKPGGYLLAFGGTRTWHRLMCGIEDAGFEVRDSVAWLYGSGFPKSLDVSTAIDALIGVKREVVYGDGLSHPQRPAGAAPATDAARQWEGWETALKPGFEPIVVARKPLVGTVAANVLEYGTGALNVDACRVGIGNRRPLIVSNRSDGNNTYGDGLYGSLAGGQTSIGRWPTNVVLDDRAGVEVDRQTGSTRSRRSGERVGVAGDGWRMTATGAEYDDEGGASRFFPIFRYEAKAPTSERPVVNGVAHPTVKPLALMRWLCRLVTQPDGLILDPFAGSGTTVEAAMLEGFRVIGIERDAQYLPLIQHRIDRAHRRRQPGIGHLVAKPPKQFDGQLDLLADLGGVA